MRTAAPKREARRRVLVAGIGNIFLGDDGFGVEVARRLAGEPLGEGVDVVDFGIRGVHLAYELLDGGYDAAILVDAAARGSAPGTLCAVEHDAASSLPEAASVDAHTLTPDAVLAWVRRVGVPAVPIVVVGCEPMSTEESMGLSEVVAAAIDPAIGMIRDLLAQLASSDCRREGVIPCA